jgi:hypothetical protein
MAGAMILPGGAGGQELFAGSLDKGTRHNYLQIIKKIADRTYRGLVIVKIKLTFFVDNNLR